MARRAISAPIVRRRYTADAEDGDTLPMSAPRLRRTDAADATDWGTLQISAPRRTKTLCWRYRPRLGRRTTKVMVRHRPQLLETTWQVGDEAWICDSEASTHMTPSADCMLNYRECNLKLRIADGSTRSIEGYGDVRFVFRSGNGLVHVLLTNCLLYTSPSPRDRQKARMPSSA